MELLRWDVYEVTTEESPLQGRKLRGTLRKFANQQQINFLVENDCFENIVRFALLNGESPKMMNDFLMSIVPDATIEQIESGIPNPVMSKMKINIDERYGEVPLS